MERERLQATYVGGPTALFEWCGFRLLTDPAFDPPGGKYENGPVVLEKTIGPAIAPETLGRVDFVLLSHDHHLDNLDHSGRKFLASVPRVITTVEGAERLGGNAVELFPWQSIEIPGADGQVLRITGTPAQHGPSNFSRGAVTPFALTMTADDGVQAAHAFSEAKIVPIHYEGWKHFSESRDVISRAFEVAGLSGRIRWMKAGTAIDV